MLLEAKDQVKHGEWKPWLTQNFHLGYDSAKIYMKLAQHEEKEKGSTLPFSSMREFREKELGHKPSVHPTPWHEEVKQAMDDQELIERIRLDTRTHRRTQWAQERRSGSRQGVRPRVRPCRWWDRTASGWPRDRALASGRDAPKSRHR
jgi:hypothetical protein